MKVSLIILIDQVFDYNSDAPSNTDLLQELVDSLLDKDLEMSFIIFG